MLGIREDIAERVLNHSRGEIVGTYDLFEFIPQKRLALEKLAEWFRSLLSGPAPHPGAHELIPAWLAKKRTRRAANKKEDDHSRGRTTDFNILGQSKRTPSSTRNDGPPRERNVAVVNSAD